MEDTVTIATQGWFRQGTAGGRLRGPHLWRAWLARPLQLGALAELPAPYYTSSKEPP